MNTSPVSRFVTTKSRLFTSLIAAAGLPAGSVQASVTCSGKYSAKLLVSRLMMYVWLSPVASALAGLWSTKKIAPLVTAPELVLPPNGREFTKLGMPQP